jgi:hypothetical protein
MDDFDPATAANLDELAACLRHVHLLADNPAYRTLVDHPGNLGGSDSWEDAGPWQHRRGTRTSCVSAR